MAYEIRFTADSLELAPDDQAHSHDEQPNAAYRTDSHAQATQAPQTQDNEQHDDKTNHHHQQAANDPLGALQAQQESSAAPNHDHETQKLLNVAETRKQKQHTNPRKTA